MKITGRIFESDSGKGIGNLIVKPLVREAVNNELLVESNTDLEGNFLISLEKKEYKEIFESQSELYLEVRSPDRSRILYASRDTIKVKSNSTYHYDVSLSKNVLGDLFNLSDNIHYGPRSGRLLFEILDENGAPLTGQKIVLLQEHKPNSKFQWKEITDKDSFDINLPAGVYTYQLYAKEYEVVRGGVEIFSGEVKSLPVILRRRDSSYKHQPVIERLKSTYGIDTSNLNLSDLTVQEGEKLQLNFKELRDEKSCILLETKNINELKQWTGVPDAAFNHEYPVFGKLPHLSERIFSDGERNTVGVKERTILAQIAQEYIQGNSVSVQQFEPILNKYLSEWASITLVPVFFYRVVTVNAGAVLEVGKNSSVFEADILRVHRDGIFSVVGPCKINVGTLEGFV